VGLVDEAGQRRFNPPSLRGVRQGRRFFHDGRAASLAAIFTRHRHELRGSLDAQQVSDLVAFLRSL
jgi:cytochrome c peroxidase